MKKTVYSILLNDIYIWKETEVHRIDCPTEWQISNQKRRLVSLIQRGASTVSWTFSGIISVRIVTKGHPKTKKIIINPQQRAHVSDAATASNCFLGNPIRLD